jgi:copper chaperone CopZ
MMILSKQSVYFNVHEMTQASDSKKIKKGIDMLHGVISVSINYDTKNVAVDFDSTGTNGEEIKNEIEKLGYIPEFIKQEDHIM